MNYLLLAAHFILIPLFAPLAVGLIRNIKAKMQNRTGASLFQPYHDLRKLFQKDEVVSEDASWITFFAPYIIFASLLAVSALIPTFYPTPFLWAFSDFIVVISLMVLSVFFMALLGLDSGNAFGGLGSSREMTLAAVTEAGLFFSFIPALIITQSTNLSYISVSLIQLSPLETASLAVAFVAFFITLLAENARYPFDNPSTHLELTMVHEAMIIEASGKRLALLEWAAMIKLLIFAILGATMFGPWLGNGGGWVPMEILFIAKVIILLSAVALLESSTPKLRYFKLPGLLISAFVLGVIALTMAVL